MTAEEAWDIRTRLGLTQTEMGHLFSVQYEVICRWESGSKPIPEKHQAVYKRLNIFLSRHGSGSRVLCYIREGDYLTALGWLLYESEPRDE